MGPGGGISPKGTMLLPWSVVRADLYECGRVAALWMALPPCPDPSHPAGVAFDVEFGREIPASIGGIPARQIGRDVVDYTLLRRASTPMPSGGSIPAGSYTVRLAYYRDADLIDLTDSLGNMDSGRWGHTVAAGGSIRCALPRPVRDGERLVAYLSNDWLDPPTNKVPGGGVFWPVAHVVEPVDPNFSQIGSVVVTGEPIDAPTYAPPRVAVMLYRLAGEPPVAPGIEAPPGVVTTAAGPSPALYAPLRDLRHAADPPTRVLPWRGTIGATIAQGGNVLGGTAEHCVVRIPPGTYSETTWPLWLGCKLTVEAETPGTVTIRPGPDGKRPCFWHEGLVGWIREIRLRGLTLDGTNFALQISGERALLEDCRIVGPGAAELTTNPAWRDGGFGRLALVRTEFRDIADDVANKRKSAVFVNNAAELFVGGCEFRRAAFCRADLSERSDQGQPVYSQSAVGRCDLIDSLFDVFGGGVQVRSRGCLWGNVYAAGPFAAFIAGGSIVEDTCVGLTDIVGLDGVSNFAADRAWGPSLNASTRVPLVYRELRDTLNVHADSSLRNANAFSVSATAVNQGVTVLDGNRHHAAGPWRNAAAVAALPGARLGPGGGVVDAGPIGPMRPGDLAADWRAARDAFRVAWGLSPCEGVAPEPTDPPTVLLEVVVQNPEFTITLPVPTYRYVVDGAVVEGNQVVAPAGATLSVRLEVVATPPVVTPAPASFPAPA
jgi:hypothetical protein